MECTQINWTGFPANIKLSRFSTVGGASESYVSVELYETSVSAEQQFYLLEEAVQRLFQLPELKDFVLVWKRFFVSDAVNQAAYIKPSANEAISVVQQQPLNQTKVAALLYFVEGAQLQVNVDGSVLMHRANYVHLFHTQLHERVGNVAHQTHAVFYRYNESLSLKECTLRDHCIRTWIFVQNVDIQYAGMVTSRREYFEQEGLTKNTHYIASTGIEGRYIYPEVLMLMDAYAVAHIKQDQIWYLQAPTHLNPTHEYGVTFERGTVVDYGDRRHVFISGTASINNEGQIEHPLDVEKQTGRVFENIQALLKKGDTTMEDVSHMIVYLRDMSDNEVVRKYIQEHYPSIPCEMVWAPICRPGWLVEVECMAIKEIRNEQFAAF